MKTQRLAAILATTALTGAAALPAFAESPAGTMGYALANDGMTLVTMASLAEPGTVETYGLSEKLHAIAYRPVTIVSVNAMTGEITDLDATFGENAMTGGDYVAFDFNNAIDAVRAVGSDGANLVYFPEGFGDGDERAGQVLRFTDAAYGAGDANEGTTPMIFANAYTNAIPGAKASETAQYALDAETDSLVTLANNDGTLGTVATIMVDGAEADISAWGGMDIVSAAEGENAAYAVLQMEGADTAGLYMIDLESGEATMLADLGMGGFSGFAASMGM